MLKSARNGENYESINKAILQVQRRGRCGILSRLWIALYFTETLHMHYLLSSMLSFTASALFNYVYSTKYVFCSRDRKNRAGQFAVFLLLSGCGLILNSLLMNALVEKLMLHYMVAKICAAMSVSVWNFVSRKVFLEEGLSLG